MELDYSLQASPNQQQVNNLAAFTQIPPSPPDIRRAIAGIEDRCNNPNAEPQTVSLYREALKPLFQAVRTYLTREISASTSIETRLAAIEKLVQKIDQKPPLTPSTIRATYASAATAGILNEHRANTQRGTRDPLREPARV